MADFSTSTSTLENDPTVRIIGICGAMTIHHADEIRAAMLEAVSGADEVRMEMTRVEEIDLVGLQLLCSAHRTSIQMNKRFSFVGGCNVSVDKTIRNAGFNRHVGCVRDVDQSCLWLGGRK